LADQRGTELADERERAGRAEEKAAALQARLQAELERAAKLELERDNARVEVTEKLHRLGQAEGLAAGLQEAVRTAQASQHEAEGRVATMEAEREVLRALASRESAALQEAQARLDELQAELEAVRRQEPDTAALEVAQARIREVEEQAAEAKRLADEADRRAAAASGRLDRLQRERLDQVQAAAAATLAQNAAPLPLWRRVFGRR
jgi:chromosome segregation ATPase